MKAWTIPQGCTDGFTQLQLSDRPGPDLGPGQVKVKMKAWSTNYRDIVVPMGLYFSGPVSKDTVPLSDGAGEVIEVGEGVDQWRIGDRVAGTFFQSWRDGPFNAGVFGSDLGGPTDGVLAEEVVLDQQGLVRLPDSLSFEEGATLPCAAVTAWNSLFEIGNVRAGQTVLVLGTGGVSLFALQFAKAAGAKVIATSSSDDKLRRLEAMGADQTINYRDNPQWGRAVLELTNQQGADHVVEVGGAGTLENSMIAVAPGGSIGLIGVLSGVDGQVNPLPLVAKAVRLQGVYVGSRSMFEAMNQFIAQHDLKPVIDTRFGFEQAPDAYAHQAGGGHMGKVVISTEL
jgi:NADPH:quinone reductase-like Zn-dependent oxidoreductase